MSVAPRPSHEPIWDHTTPEMRIYLWHCVRLQRAFAEIAAQLRSLK